MKVLCDVHIARRVVAFYLTLGCEALHINDILSGSETKDAAIAQYADEHEMVVLTKDKDFLDTHLIKKTPRRLIKINLGNISNNTLLEILNFHHATFCEFFKKGGCVEVNTSYIVTHPH